MNLKLNLRCKSKISFIHFWFSSISFKIKDITLWQITILCCTFMHHFIVINSKVSLIVISDTFEKQLLYVHITFKDLRKSTAKNKSLHFTVNLSRGFSPFLLVYRPISCFSHDIMRKWEIIIRMSEFLSFSWDFFNCFKWNHEKFWRFHANFSLSHENKRNAGDRSNYNKESSPKSCGNFNNEGSFKVDFLKKKYKKSSTLLPTPWFP